MSLQTQLPQQKPVPPVLAAGIRMESEVFLFRNFSDDRILLGRGAQCHIRFDKDDKYVSHIHALIERLHDGHFLANKSSLGYTFIDGTKITRPEPLHVGHVITLGDRILVATDEQGMFPIDAYGHTDLYVKAVEYCGGYRPAARWLQRDHSTVRRNFERWRKQRKNTRR